MNKSALLLILFVSINMQAADSPFDDAVKEYNACFDNLHDYLNEKKILADNDENLRIITPSVFNRIAVVLSPLIGFTLSAKYAPVAVPSLYKFVFENFATPCTKNLWQHQPGFCWYEFSKGMFICSTVAILGTVVVAWPIAKCLIQARNKSQDTVISMGQEINAFREEQLETKFKDLLKRLSKTSATLLEHRDDLLKMVSEKRIALLEKATLVGDLPLSLDLLSDEEMDAISKCIILQRNNICAICLSSLDATGELKQLSICKKCSPFPCRLRKNEPMPDLSH